MKTIDKQLLNKLPDSVVTDHVQCEKELNKSFFAKLTKILFG